MIYAKNESVKAELILNFINVYLLNHIKQGKKIHINPTPTDKTMELI